MKELSGAAAKWILRNFFRGVMLAPIGLLSLFLVGLCLAGIFFWLRGDSFFAARPLFLFGFQRYVIALDGYVPYLLMYWSAAVWLLFRFLPSQFQGRVETLNLMRRGYIYFGLPAILGLFFLHLGSLWAYPGDISSYGSIIGGIVPFSDSAGHFSLPIAFSQSGQLDPWILRRPIGSIFRVSLAWLAGYSPEHMIGLQVVLLGLSVWVLGLAISAYHGIISAVTCIAFVFLHTRILSPTFLLEPLGATWACLSIAAFVIALQKNTLMMTLVAYFALIMGLLTRMGAMFLAPFLALWVVWRFRHSRKSLLAALLGVALSLGLAVGWQKALVDVYGLGQNQPGSNFSYVFVGLTNGANWADASVRYGPEIANKPEKEVAQILYQKAIENLRRDPMVFLKRIASGAVAFCRDGFLFRPWDSRKSGLIAWLLLSFCLVRIFRDRAFFLFSLTVTSACVLSAAFVYFDEGNRVMIIGYLFLAAILSLGLTIPQESEHATLHLPRFPSMLTQAAIVCLTIFMVSGPLLARLDPVDVVDRLSRDLETSAEEIIIWGGKSMAGVLVVPDEQPLSRTVPSMHLSQFIESVKVSGVEYYQKIVTPIPPQPPFAFILPVSPGRHFIAPPEVLEQRNVAIWSVKTKDLPDAGSYVTEIVQARPM